MRVCLQGGGVAVLGGTVTFSSCTITGNTADNVRAHPQKFPSPPWERLMFCSFLQGGGVYVSSGTVTMTSCSITGNTASGSVRAHVKTSHCPDGIFTCFALESAGRRCLHRLRHGELLMVHHHWQYSYWLLWLCVCSRSKVPIAPMGISHVLRLCHGLCLHRAAVFILAVAR